SPVLVRFSIIAKPYESDALVAAALIACALETMAMPDSATRWRWLLGGGVGGLALSAPAIFTLAGIVVSLALAPSVRGTSGARSWLTIAAVVWGAAFAAFYFGLYRSVATSAFMQQFWAATSLGRLRRGGSASWAEGGSPRRPSSRSQSLSTPPMRGVSSESSSWGAERTIQSTCSPARRRGRFTRRIGPRPTRDDCASSPTRPKHRSLCSPRLATTWRFLIKGGARSSGIRRECRFATGPGSQRRSPTVAGPSTRPHASTPRVARMCG